MAKLTNIIGGQPYAAAVTDAPVNTDSKLLDFWKGTQGQYESATLKRTGGAISPYPNNVTNLVFTGLTTAAGMGWEVGDVVYVTGSSNNTTRTRGSVASVQGATGLTITMDAGYTNTDTSGYQVDKYYDQTLYFIT